MLRLSIVIPVLRAFDALEETLVSVLENRPADCEVLVVSAEPYDDPYDLADEVRFVSLPGARRSIDLINHGFQLCAAPHVHVLACGAEVSEGWADAPLACLEDSAAVAAVAPLVLADRDSRTIVSAGMKYSAGGSRTAALEGVAAERAGSTPGKTLGPGLLAGFYCRDAIQQVGEVLSVDLGDHLADVDLALRLKRAGYEAVFEPSSIVYRSRAELSQSQSFHAARLAERLFWRNAPSLGWARSLILHAIALLGSLLHPVQLLARATVWVEFPRLARHHQTLGELAGTAPETSVTCKLEAPSTAASAKQRPQESLRRAA